MCPYSPLEGHVATWPFDGPCGPLGGSVATWLFQGPYGHPGLWEMGGGHVAIALKGTMWPPCHLRYHVLTWTLERPCGDQGI